MSVDSSCSGSDLRCLVEPPSLLWAFRSMSKSICKVVWQTFFSLISDMMKLLDDSVCLGCLSDFNSWNWKYTFTSGHCFLILLLIKDISYYRLSTHTKTRWSQPAAALPVFIFSPIMCFELILGWRSVACRTLSALLGLDRACAGFLFFFIH